MNIRRVLADAIHARFSVVSSLLSFLWGFFWSPNKSYSLYGEDLILQEIFAGNNSGIYIDIGAFHSRWISNTHALAKSGWKGVAVDIDRSKLWSFRFRPRCITKVGAVVPSNFDKDLISIFKFRRMSSEWDTISLRDANETRHKYGVEYDVCEVAALPINILLTYAVEKYNCPINYINIDVEGADEMLLMSINIRDYGVEVIQFENNNEFPGSNALRLKLENEGYMHLATQGGTHTYIWRELLAKRFMILNQGA